MFKQANRGFTLLGILLIITVVMGVSLYLAMQMQLRAKIHRVELTAMRMQTILEAMAAYNLLNFAWPQSFSDLTTNDKYLSPSVLCSPWPMLPAGQSSCRATIGGSFSNSLQAFTMGTSNNQTQGTLSITLPDSKTATMVKHAIGGSTIRSGTTVMASILAPSGDPTNRIAKMGITMEYDTFYQVPDTFQVPKPSCPTGMQPNIFVMPQSWNAQPLDGGAPTLGGGVPPFKAFGITCNKYCDCDYQEPHHDAIGSGGWKIRSRWYRGKSAYWSSVCSYDSKNSCDASMYNPTGVIAFFTICTGDKVRWTPGKYLNKSGTTSDCSNNHNIS